MACVFPTSPSHACPNPRKLDTNQFAAACAVHDAGQAVAQVTKALGASRSTPYPHLTQHTEEQTSDDYPAATEVHP